MLTDSSSDEEFRRIDMARWKFWVIILVCFTTLQSVAAIKSPKATIGLLLPANPPNYNVSIKKTVPALQIAIEKVREMQIYQDIQVKYADSKCSNKFAPIAAMHMNREVSVFFGPFCDYAADPVAR